MKHASFLKKKKTNRKAVSVLVAVGIILVGGLLLKKIADSQSRVDY